MELDFPGLFDLKERNTRLAPARRPGKRPAPNILPGDIIELTDSEDDLLPPPRPQSRRNMNPTRPEPLFLADSDDEPPLNAPLAAPPPRASVSRLSPVSDPADAYVAQVLEIVPDVLPAHVFDLVQNREGNVVEQVLHLLFEDPTYPKASNKGKGKRKRERDDDAAESSSAPVKVKIDYASEDREPVPGFQYSLLSLDQLRVDYPFVPLAYIRRKFIEHKEFYAPTYFALQAEIQSGKLSFIPLSSAYRAKSRGKKLLSVNLDFERERQWLLAKLQDDALKEDAEVAAQLEDEESGLECGCCFSNCAFNKMVQCPEAHLFCVDCVSRYAAGKLGEHNANLTCMDQSGCQLAFPESELRRFLTPKLLELYDRVKQRKEIEAAGLENLEECPFCEYRVVIDNEQEKLFRCEREDCGAVSCRACKRLDHLPKNCKEAEEDKKLDGRHEIEEAMTRALLRNCPKCDKAFMKESGCNKMTCPECRTILCYVCRSIITGYDHFNQQPGQTIKNNSNSKKCVLWDTSVDARHVDEVTAAAKTAMEEYKRNHPDVDEKDIRVDLPKPVAGPSTAPAPGAPRGLLGVALPHPGPPPAPNVGIGIGAQFPPHFLQPPPPMRAGAAALFNHPVPQLPDFENLPFLDGRGQPAHFGLGHQAPVPQPLPPMGNLPVDMGRRKTRAATAKARRR